MPNTVNRSTLKILPFVYLDYMLQFFLFLSRNATLYRLVCSSLFFAKALTHKTCEDVILHIFYVQQNTIFPGNPIPRLYRIYFIDKIIAMSPCGIVVCSFSKYEHRKKYMPPDFLHAHCDCEATRQYGYLYTCYI